MAARGRCRSHRDRARPGVGAIRQRRARRHRRRVRAGHDLDQALARARHARRDPWLRERSCAPPTCAAGYIKNGVSLRGSASLGAVSDLRAGDGIDSHSAVTRFLGIPSSHVGDKLEYTGYSTKRVFGRRALAGRRQPQPLAVVSPRRAGRRASLRPGDRRQRPLSQRVRTAAARLRVRALRERAASRSSTKCRRPSRSTARPMAVSSRRGRASASTARSTPRRRWATRRRPRAFLAAFPDAGWRRVLRREHRRLAPFDEPNGSVVRAAPDIPDGTTTRPWACSCSRART